MPGQEVKGLSGGQRKIAIVAHINAVLSRQSELQLASLVVLDEHWLV